jgi:hypothetical protein
MSPLGLGVGNIITTRYSEVFMDHQNEKTVEAGSDWTSLIGFVGLALLAAAVTW